MAHAPLAPLPAACMRQRRSGTSVLASKEPLSDLLTTSLSWLNWDVSRSYGIGTSSKPAPPGGASSSGSGAPDRAGSWPSGSETATIGSSSGSAPGSEGFPEPRESPAASGDDAASGASASASAMDPSKLQRIREAFASGSLGFGFSAGGLMFPYYVGVVSALEEMGVLKRPHQVAGASAGSLIAASFNSGLDMRVVEESMVLFGEDCMQNGVRYRLGPLLRDFLHAYLPPDAHERCSGTTHIAWTRMLPVWQPKLASHFQSRDDLIEALMTSCHIPWYSDGKWMTKYRGHFALDGGATNFIPVVPGVEYTCKVMCFPTYHLEAIRSRAAKLPLADRYLDIDISLDSFEEWPHGWDTVLKWALQASTRETSSFLIEKGKRDARAWVVATGLDALLLPGVPSAAAAWGREAEHREPLVLHLGAANGAARPAGRLQGTKELQQAEGHVVLGKRHREDGPGPQGAAGGSDGGGEASGSGSGGGDAAPGEARRSPPDGAGGGDGDLVPAIPGLTGQPRTSTDPLHDKTPA